MSAFVSSMSSVSPQMLLPPSAYTGLEWFEAEQRNLFSRAWLFAGLVSDVPAAGDYLTINAGRDPIVVVRQKDGALVAFHNLCRHRGVVLLEGTGNVSSGISCFYHRWHYNMDGSLRGVPQNHQFPSVMADKASFGLLPAHLAEWKGMIFVAVEPVEPFAHWIAPVEARWGPWLPAELLEVSDNSLDVAANWKLFIENHIDGYHLWHLHSETVKGLSHDKQIWHPSGRHWTFYEPESEPGKPVPDLGLPFIPGIGPDRLGSSVFMLFPNIGGAGGASFFSIFVVEPLAPEKTRVRFRTFIKKVTDADMAADPELATRLMDGGSSGLGAGTNDNPALSVRERLHEAAKAGDFVLEDKIVAEAIQRGLRSSRFSTGPLSPDYEASLPFFQRNCIAMTKDKVSADDRD